MANRKEEESQSASLPATHPQSQSRDTTTATAFPKPLSTSSQSTRSDEETADAAAALAGFQSLESDMDPEGSAGHRRRRSSLMNPLNADAKKSPRTRSPLKDGSILEESKPGDRGVSLDASGDLDLSEDDALQDDEETGLTGKDKSKRRRRKRGNTLLDQRIVGSTSPTAEEKQLADKNVIKKGLVNGLLIVLWYTFSLSISIVSSECSL